MSNNPLNDLARVRAAFEQWRSLGSKRGRIPEHLWQAAISLLDQHSQSHICRELRLTARRTHTFAARDVGTGFCTRGHPTLAESATLLAAFGKSLVVEITGIGGNRVGLI